MIPIILYGIFFGISISVPIGPANLELIKRGLTKGYRSALGVGLGTAISDSLLSVLAYIGVIPLFNKIGMIKIVLYCGGGLVLMAIGGFSIYQTFTLEDPLSVPEEQSQWAERYHNMNPVLLGFTINTTNPMVIGFWIFFFSTVAEHGLFGRSLSELFVFSSSVFLGAMLWFATLATLVHWGKQHVNKMAYKVISSICNTVMIIMGAYFIISFFGITALIRNFFQ
jgi:threonine/homoserine/homoserine lactone efflux protein